MRNDAREARSCFGVPLKETLPEIREPLPGPNSVALAERLRLTECPEVTDLREAPPFWERGRGSNVFDVDGNCFVDLVASFGAACLGHANSELAEVSARQSQTLLHGMGDVFPTRLKLELLEALQARLPGDLGHAILSSSGSDAVESALKTAMRVTGRGGFIAFEGGYHGLGFGALSVTHRELFRAPFESRLASATYFAPFGDAAAVRGLLNQHEIAGIVVEPIQGRGGLRIPPADFLQQLRTLATEFDALLICDEVFTGWGRSGRWLACETLRCGSGFGRDRQGARRRLSDLGLCWPPRSHAGLGTFEWRGDSHQYASREPARVRTRTGRPGDY